MTMASLCLTQSGYTKPNQFQYNNMMMLQQQQQHQQQYLGNKQQQATALAPSKVLGNNNLQNILPAASCADPMLNKRKYTYANMPYGEQLPSVARRNARERNRVKQVNNGFANLRQHIPQTVINNLSSGGRGASKKLSKVDTLRIAVEYIRGMMDMLESSEQNDNQETNNEGKENFNYSSSMGSPSNESEPQYQTQFFHSETSASPAPSYTGSDISNGGADYFQPLKLEEEPQVESVPFKFEPFENYQNFTQEEQPDDEELLDYISSWQEQ